MGTAASSACPATAESTEPGKPAQHKLQPGSGDSPQQPDPISRKCPESTGTDIHGSSSAKKGSPASPRGGDCARSNV